MTLDAQLGARGAGGARRRRHGLRLVVAEDDPEMRRLLVQGLSRDGHTVTLAQDGLEAERLVRDDAPDVAVLDVRMPGRTGLQVLRALRERGSPVRVVLITGFGDASLHDEAERLGVLRVLDKPFDLDDLRDALDDVPSRGGGAGEGELA